MTSRYKPARLRELSEEEWVALYEEFLAIGDAPIDNSDEQGPQEEAAPPVVVIKRKPIK